MTLPKVKNGCSVMVVGAKSTHKTGAVINKCMDAIETHGARVLYIATEGSNGIETARLPAYRKARGMTWEKLDAHWRTVSERFNLTTSDDVADIVVAYRDFAPSIVVI